jgi:uncharacterized Fe-S cluster-containing protein
MKQERDRLVASLPRKDCAACGAPSCEVLATDVLRGEARIEDCVFVKLDQLASDPSVKGTEAPR